MSLLSQKWRRNGFNALAGGTGMVRLGFGMTQLTQPNQADIQGSSSMECINKIDGLKALN